MTVMESMMALDQTTVPARIAPQKDLYEVGEMPPLGHVPAQMYAWTIRRERHGEPEVAFQVEVVAVPRPASDEVLVMVLAAGVNYNGVWAGLGIPVSPFDIHKADSSQVRCRGRFINCWLCTQVNCANDPPGVS